MFSGILHHLSRAQRRLALPAALAVMVIGGLVTASVATTAPAGSRVPLTQRPTVVLVHGAWADGSTWSGVVRRLQRHGYPVRVPPVTLRSLASDASDLKHFVSTIEGPVVLVGHSYGGGVISNMPIDPDVEALVFVNGFAPAAGEALVTLSGPGSALAVPDPSTVFDFVPYTGGPDGDVELYLKQKTFRTAFGNDLSTSRADVLWAGQRPVTGSAGNEPSATPAWLSVPSWYARNLAPVQLPIRPVSSSVEDRDLLAWLL
jgi:pimeloyl-ACP methyl ester carboxylesterase